MVVQVVESRRDVWSGFTILNGSHEEVDEPIQRIGVDGLDVLQTRDAEEQDLRRVRHLRGPTLISQGHVDGVAATALSDTRRRREGTARR